MIRAMAFCWVVDVSGRDEAVRGKLLHQLDHIPARNMELLGQMIERWPSITFPPAKSVQVGIKLLPFLGNLWPLLKPLRHPNPVE